MAAATGFIVSVYDLDLQALGERMLALPIRVGRSSLNDVCVSHRLVSEFHARIEEVDGKLCVRDVSSKNGVLVETVGSEGAARVTAQTPIDLEPYGFEFLLSPLLRVRVRPATNPAAVGMRQSQALGSVLGNARGHLPPEGGFAIPPASALAEDQLTEGFSPPQPRVSVARPPRHDDSPPASSSPPRPARISLGQTAQQGSPPVPAAPGATRPGATRQSGSAPSSPASAGVSAAVQPYSSVFVDAPAGSLELPPLPASARNGERYPSTPRPALLETRPHGAPQLAHTAWEVGPGTLPAAAAAAVQALPTSEPPGRSIEALALRGLRELAASLVPGQSVETASDVVVLITKLHDALETFCRCFIPVREACSRFISTDELERAAIERCQHASSSYVAIERALEPRAVAAALLDWRSDDQDAPRAVEHILADLMLHHLGLSQAALDGTRALLDELSPARIDGQEPAPTPTLLSRLGLASAREKDLWEAFARRHAELEAVGRTFRALFGDQFTRAYLAQAPMPGSGPSL